MAQLISKMKIKFGKELAWCVAMATSIVTAQLITPKWAFVRVLRKIGILVQKQLLWSAVLAIPIVMVQLGTLGLVRDSILQTAFAYVGTVLGLFTWSLLPFFLKTVADGWNMEHIISTRFCAVLLTVFISLIVFILAIFPQV